MGGVSERLFPARANADLVRRENERPGTRDWVLTSAMNPAVERGRSEKSVGVFGGVMTSAARLPVSVGHGDVRSPRSRAGLSRPEAAGGLRAHGDGAPKVILIIAGTRPECIKLASVVRALEKHPMLSVALVNSGQHLQAVRDSLAEFGLRSDLELPSLPTLSHLAASHQHLRLGCRPQIGMARNGSSRSG